MYDDPIVNEVRKHRQAHANKYGNDIALIAEALRKLQSSSGRNIINQGPKLIETNTEKFNSSVKDKSIEEGSTDSDPEAFLAILNREGGEPPRPGDELPH